MVSQSYGFGSAYRGFKNHRDGKAAEHICFYNSLIIVKKKKTSLLLIPRQFSQ